MLKNEINLRIFLFTFLAVYMTGVWVPQFLTSPYTQSNIASPMGIIGNDLKGIYVSAKRLVEGKNPRFFEDGDQSDFPSAVSGVIHAYGPLATVLLIPFSKFDFEFVRLFILFLSIAIFFLINWREGRREGLDWTVALILPVLLMMGSPGINLLLERGQLEILACMAIYFFYIGYLTDLRCYHLFSLGMAIHLKIWPIVFLPLMLNKRYFKEMILSGVFALLPHIVFSPWLNPKDFLKAIKVYGNYTKDFFGGHNISMSSALFKFTGLTWVISAIIFLSVMLILQIRTRDLDTVFLKKIKFSMSLVIGLIITGCEFQYVIASLVIITPFIIRELGKPEAALAALAFSPLAYSSDSQGYMKAVLLFSLWILISKRVHLSTTTAK